MKVYFFYPSKVVGGAEFLFLNIANKLSETSKYDISFIDYLHGFTENKLLESINRLEYVENEKIIIPHNTVVIVQLNQISKLNKYFEFQGNYYPLFWGINPNNLVGIIKPHGKTITTKKFRTNCGSLISDLIVSGNIIFMDSANQIALEKVFNFKHVQSEYVPVPIDEKRIKKDWKPSDIRSSVIRFAWLGRLDFDKVPTLETFMNEIEDFNKTQKSSLTIIGIGSEFDYVNKIKTHYSYEVNCVGALLGKELDAFIDDNVDIGIAMGTSILEFSKRGVPVILKGFMNKALNSGACKDFLILNEIEGYSLGSMDGIELGNPFESSFKSKAQNIIADYKAISQKCYDYVRYNHTIENSSSLFSKAIDRLLVGNNLEVSNLLALRFDKIENRMEKIKRIVKSFNINHTI